MNTDKDYAISDLPDLKVLSEDISEDITELLAYIERKITTLTVHHSVGLIDEIEAYASSLYKQYAPCVDAFDKTMITQDTDKENKVLFAASTAALAIICQFSGRFQECINYLDLSDIYCSDSTERFLLRLESATTRFVMRTESPSHWPQVVQYLSKTIVSLYEALHDSQDFDLMQDLFLSSIPPHVILRSMLEIDLSDNLLEIYHHCLLSYLYLEMENFHESAVHLEKARNLKYPKTRKMQVFIKQLDAILAEREVR